MKKTGPLSALGDYSFDEKTINIHPNDGYDLGMMTASYVVKIFAGATAEEFESGQGKSVYGTIHLKNECRVGSVELSLKVLERLGKPKQVVLGFETGDDKYGKLLISPVV